MGLWEVLLEVKGQLEVMAELAALICRGAQVSTTVMIWTVEVKEAGGELSSVEVHLGLMLVDEKAVLALKCRGGS